MLRDSVAHWWKWALKPDLGYRIMECEHQSKIWTESEMKNQKNKSKIEQKIKLNINEKITISLVASLYMVKSHYVCK